MMLSMTARGDDSASRSWSSRTPDRTRIRPYGERPGGPGERPAGSRHLELLGSSLGLVGEGLGRQVGKL